MGKDRKKSRKPLIISILILASVVSAYFLVPDVRLSLNRAWEVLTSGDPQQTREWVAGFGWLGPLVIIIVMVLQMFLIIIPSWLLMIVAIIAYGPVWGSLIVLIGIFVASSTGYIIGRYVGPEVTVRLIGEKAQNKISDFIDQYGAWAIMITRINPLLSNDAISFMAGLLKMRYRVFILSTMVGILPLVILIAWLGQLTGGLKKGLVWLSIISLAGFIIFVIWDRRQQKKNDRH